MPESLSARHPSLTVEGLVDEFVPPPHFADVRFDTYVPDPVEPTQGAAVAALRAFAGRITDPAPAKRSFFRRAAPPEGRAGVYLDGGFDAAKLRSVSGDTGRILMWSPYERTVLRDIGDQLQRYGHDDPDLQHWLHGVLGAGSVILAVWMTVASLFSPRKDMVK